jgi:hypothetical protein
VVMVLVCQMCLSLLLINLFQCFFLIEKCIFVFGFLLSEESVESYSKYISS